VGDTIRDIVLLHVDIIISFPWLVLLLLLLSVFGNDSVLVVIYIFALVLLPRVAGVIQELFRSTPAGINRRRRFFMITSVALLFTTAGIIIFLATISYLGYGIHPPYPELGFMLSRSTYIYTYISPWIILWPGVILVAVVFAFILAGNTLLEKFGFKSTAVWGKMLE
jgi:peptide/nickel transport system permease protein